LKVTSVFETQDSHILLLHISCSTPDATFPFPHIRERYQKGKLVSSSTVLVLYMRSILWWQHTNRCRSKFISYL